MHASRDKRGRKSLIVTSLLAIALSGIRSGPMDFKRKGGLQESTSVFCGFFGDKFVLPLIADGRPPSKKNNRLCIAYKNLATSLITRKAMRCS